MSAKVPSLGKAVYTASGPCPAPEQTGRAHAPGQYGVNISGEPGAYRKAHAGFGERRPETPRGNPRSASDSYSTHIPLSSPWARESCTIPAGSVHDDRGGYA
jgi:hypothetical protein